MQILDAGRFRLAPGATIGVAAPAGPYDENQFATGLSVLISMGFRVNVDPRISARQGFLAGGDRQRADVLHGLFENAEVAAIICARGGYGCLRLLPMLDAGIICRNPKPIIGFSDITALLAFAAHRCGTAAIHGPVVTSLATADAVTVAGLQRLLSGLPLTIAAHPKDILAPGTAAGLLMGGNLTTLNHLLATGFMPDFRGCILLLEDIHEAPYRLDRMLCQMRLAGCFDGVVGLVLGTFSECGEPAQVRDVIISQFESLAIPILGGLPIGHGTTNMAVPLGVPAVLDTVSATLRIEFSGSESA